MTSGAPGRRQNEGDEAAVWGLGEIPGGGAAGREHPGRASRLACDLFSGGRSGGGVFVGREAEQASLTDLLARAERGHPWLVTIEGESGVGKTALARRCLASSPGLRVLWARADSTESDLDYGVVDQLARGLPRRGLAAGSLLAGGGERPSPLTVGAELLAMVGNQLDVGPLAVVVDDVQWADRPSVVVKVLDAQSFPVQDGTQVTYTVRPVGGQQSGSAVFANGQIQATAGIRAGDGLSSSPQLIAQRAGTIQVTAEVLSSRYDPKATFDLVVVAQRPTTIDILNGNYQFVSPNSAFGSPLTVRVLDQVGHAIPGATTNFAVTGPALANGNSRYAPATDPNGQASALLTATDGSGPVTVTVTSGSTSTVFTEYVPYNGIVSMHQLRGQGQQTNSGQPFPARPTVLVQDGQNMGVSGFPVTFKVSGPATFADGAVSATVTSQQDGTAASPTLTATSGSGQVTVVATITGNSASATFTLKVNPVATLTIVGGDRQSSPTSTNPVLPTAFRTPLTVKATEATGRPGVSALVKFTVSGPANFNIIGSQKATSVPTDKNGNASVRLFAEVDSTGTVTVTASSPDFGQVAFSETVVARTN